MVKGVALSNGSQIKVTGARVSSHIAHRGINPRILDEVKKMVDNASKEQKVLISVEKYHFF